MTPTLTYSYIPPTSDNSGYTIVCNGKNLKTPQGRPLVVPSEKLARAIVGEWQKQGDKIRRELLEFTPLACVAIDLASDKRASMLADIVPYIDTDMVCYRAGEIPALLKQQQEQLDPVMEWAEQKYGLKLAVTGGIMPVAQDPKNAEKLAALLDGFNEWKLAAFCVALKPLGSVVLALALIEGRVKGAEAFALSHMEENFETAKWGVDAEKEQQLAGKKRDVLAVEEFLRML